MTADPQAIINSLYANQRSQQARVEAAEKQLSEVMSLLRQQANMPKWVEEIPGKRSNYFAVIEITIAALSTAKAEGTYTVSTDGPFVITAIAMWYQRTTAPYNGNWRPATAVDARIAPASQHLGFQYIYDDPVLGTFDVEFAESGSDRNWQNSPFASALFSPSVGCCYVLPVAQLVGRAGVVTCRVTPGVAQPYAGKVQCLLLGYKIVQGDTYQP